MAIAPEPAEQLDAPPGERRLLRLVLAGAALALVIVAVLAALYFTRGGQSQSAAKLPALQPLQRGGNLLLGDVQQVDGSTLTLSTANGARTVTLGAGTRVEALLPAKLSDISVGDYLTVGGIPNQVNSFAVKLVVDIPAADVGQPVDGIATSKGGFTGWETYTDVTQMPEVSGKVAAIDASGVHIAGPTGDALVQLDDQAPLRRLITGSADLIHGGDHVAVQPGAPPPAVLVLPQ
jgi:hypothetical protein